MGKISELSIGIIGGRSYGKTVFLTKLLDLADSDENGFVSVEGKASDLLKLKNSLLKKDGNLPATTWEDITQFQFRLTNASGLSWRIRFFDYPGEFFEKIYLESKPPDKSAGTDEPRHAGLILDRMSNVRAKKIKKWIRSCDALIILVPVDISDTSKYSRESIDLYKNNLGPFLTALKDKTKSPKLPVCMAVNKWDLAETDVNDFPDFIKDPPYRNFYSLLNNHCRASFLCMPVSAFGKHLEGQPDKIDPEGIPINVSEMLITLARRAEYARYKAFSSRVGQMYCIGRISSVPFSTLRMKLKYGATLPRVKTALSKISRKYWLYFATASAILVVALGSGFIAIKAFMDYQYYQQIEKALTGTIETKAELVQIKKNIEKDSFLKALFADKISNLNTQHADSTLRYDQIVDNRIKEELERLKDDFKYHPDLRNKLAKDRKRFITQKIVDFSNAEYTQYYTQRLRDEDILIEDIREHRDFDEDISILYAIQPKEKSRQIDQFMEKYPLSKYPKRARVIADLLKEQELIEKKLHETLRTRLDEFKDIPEFAWKARIDRAEKRIGMIQSQAQEFSVNSTYLKTHADKINQEKALIRQLNQYGPLDDAFATIFEWVEKGQNQDTVLLAIHNLLREYDARNYPDRSQQYDELNQKREMLEVRFNEEMDEKIQALVIPISSDWQNLSHYYSQKCKIINEFQSRFPQGSQHYSRLERKKEEWKNEENRFRTLASLKKALEGIPEMDKERPDLKLAEAKRLLTTYSSEFLSEPDLADQETTLRAIIKNCNEKLVDNLDSKLNAYPLDPSMTEDQKNMRLQILRRYLGLFVEESPEYMVYSNMYDREARELSTDKKIAEFELNHRELKSKLRSPTLSPNEKIREIEAFQAKFSEEEYPFNRQILQSLNQDKERYLAGREWQRFRGKVDDHIKRFPAENDPELLTKYRDICRSYLKSINEYEKYSHIASQVRKIRNDLKDRIQKVDNLVGDGSFTNISEQFEKYKDHPTKANYTSLNNLILSFDFDRPGNARYKEVIKQIKRKAKEIETKMNEINRVNQKENELCSAVEEHYHEFIKNPIQANFVKFKKSVLATTKIECQEGDVSKYADYYIRLIHSNPISFKMKLIGYYFEDTKFSRWGDVRFKLLVKGKSGKGPDIVIIHIKAKDDWDESKDYKVLAGRFEVDQKLEIGADLVVEFGSYAHYARAVKGKDSISYYEIVARGADNGSFQHDFKDIGTRAKSGSKPGVVTIEFSGLPRLEK